MVKTEKKAMAKGTILLDRKGAIVCYVKSVDPKGNHFVSDYHPNTRKTIVEGARANDWVLDNDELAKLRYKPSSETWI